MVRGDHLARCRRQVAAGAALYLHCLTSVVAVLCPVMHLCRFSLDTNQIVETNCVDRVDTNYVDSRY